MGSRRLIERYILGTDEDANRDPLAAPIEENPQRYYDFPYKLGAETWSTNYPIPMKPQFDILNVDPYAQNGGGNRMDDAHMEEIPAWQQEEKGGGLFSSSMPEVLLALPPL